MDWFGCLEILPDLIFESIFEGYWALVRRIIPQDLISKRFRTIFKIIIYVFTGLLYFIMVIGIFTLIYDDEDSKNLGRYMVYIPLAISLVQILFGIIMRVTARKE